MYNRKTTYYNDIAFIICVCCLHSTVLWQHYKIFYQHLCKSYNLKNEMAKGLHLTSKAEAWTSCSCWACECLRSACLLTWVPKNGDSRNSNALLHGLWLWSGVWLAERWGHGAKPAGAPGFFLYLSPVNSSALLSLTWVICPESYKRSLERVGLYPLLAFSLKLE